VSTQTTQTTQPLVRIFNPNTSTTVTDSVVRAIAPVVAASAFRFESATAASGPEGIVTQEDFDQAQLGVVAYVAGQRDAADAFVVACFSDPGVDQARMASGGKPVLGLGEAGLRAALRHGKRVGVVAIADAAIPRHMRHWAQMGLQDSVVGERALNLRVDQSGDPAVAWETLREAGRRLRDVDGADVLLLGCAGMADLRAPLEDALGMPVIEPCAAAAIEALKLLGDVGR